MRQNYYWGIHLEHSSNHNVLVENFITENRGGINVHFGSHFNVILRNRMTNGTYGMILNNADSNIISQNSITHLELGLDLQADADYNIITKNNITSCNNGTELRQASNNSFYNNNFNNSRQVVISTYGYANFWDDGYPSGGNYWSDYEERYPNASEIDDSGIWDTPYVVDENNQDNYPLMAPISVMPWDITGPDAWISDGKCDMRDIGLVATLFGSVEGDGTYDARADITGPTYLERDGKIDMRDVGLVASHFGEIYP